MRRHAWAEVEGDAVEMIARSRRTIRSAFPEAGDIRIAVVPAARALREVAAKRGEMTDLRSGETKRCGGKARIGFCDVGVGGDRGDGGERADA
jgi:hypothetical protein